MVETTSSANSAAASSTTAASSKITATATAASTITSASAASSSSTSAASSTTATSSTTFASSSPTSSSSVSSSSIASTRVSSTASISASASASATATATSQTGESSDTFAIVCGIIVGLIALFFVSFVSWRLHKRRRGKSRPPADTEKGDYSRVSSKLDVATLEQQQQQQQQQRSSADDNDDANSAPLIPSPNSTSPSHNSTGRDDGGDSLPAEAPSDIFTPQSRQQPPQLYIPYSRAATAVSPLARLSTSTLIPLQPRLTQSPENPATGLSSLQGSLHSNSTTTASSYSSSVRGGARAKHASAPPPLPLPAIVLEMPSPCVERGGGGGDDRATGTAAARHECQGDSDGTGNDSSSSSRLLASTSSASGGITATGLHRQSALKALTTAGPAAGRRPRSMSGTGLQRYYSPQTFNDVALRTADVISEHEPSSSSKQRLTPRWRSYGP